MTAPVEILGDRMSIHFDSFGSDNYALFLKAKALPEGDITYVPESETYRITAPARFAAMLGVENAARPASDLKLSPFLFDDQVAITRMALDCKRFAYWGDCGLGKTLVGLEYGRHVIDRTDGRVLIFTLNDLVPSWIDEAQHFYGDSLPILKLKSRQEMKEWAKGDMQQAPKLAITNYEKLNFKGDGEQVVSELRHLAGVIPDEASRLKAGGGKQKWALIKSCKGIEYKLPLTATPAPNDTMEFASQAAFCEKMRSQGEIIWTFFQRNEKTHRWDVKPHAREAFFTFLAGWSIYVRDPKRYGWRKGFPDVPAPQTIQHSLSMTGEQRLALARFTRDKSGQMSLIDKDDRNAIDRNKLSQVAKGFVYRKGGQGAFDRIASVKPAFVAELARQELAAGLQVLIWTVFDAESQLIVEELNRLGIAGQFQMLHGSTKADQRWGVLDRFRRGQIPGLVSKGKLIGFGQNFQCCGSMIFSGFNDSYESFYQQICRAVRYDQKLSVRVHMPMIEELEGDMWENLLIKRARHEAAITRMEANYIRAQKKLGLAA